MLDQAAPTPADADPTLPGKAARPWYVCMTKPRQEAFAEGRLLQQGFEVYLPKLIRWQRQQARWQQVSQTAFPRYLFVRPSSAQQSLEAVRSTPGVSGLVRFGHVLGCMQASQVEALRAMLADLARLQPDQPIQPGAAVAFSTGPLKGLHALASSVSADRVLVMLTLLGCERTLSVPLQQLELA